MHWAIKKSKFIHKIKATYNLIYIHTHMRSVPNLKPWLTFAPCPIPLRQNNGMCPGNPNTKDPTIAHMTPSAHHITSNVCSDVCYLSNQSQVLMDRGRGDWPVVTLFHPCSPLSVHLQHTISPVFGQLVRACVSVCVSQLSSVVAAEHINRSSVSFGVTFLPTAGAHTDLTVVHIVTVTMIIMYDMLVMPHAVRKQPIVSLQWQKNVLSFFLFLYFGF